MKRILLTLLISAGWLLTSAQSDGTLDPTFGAGGLVTVDNNETDDGSDQLYLPDKGILVGGTSNIGGYDFSFCLFTAAGALNTSFGTGGKLILDIDNGSYDVLHAVALDSNQMIVGAGYSYIGGSEYMTVVRLDGDGNLDPDFGTNGIVLLNPDITNIAYDVAIQPDHKIVIAGYVADGLTPQKAMVIRLHEDGSYDSAFGDNGVWQGSPDPVYDVKAYSVALQPDGKILLGGYHDLGGDAQFAVGRILPAGSMDVGFDTDGWVVKNPSGGLDVVHSVAVQNDGKIVLAGETSGQVIVTRLNSDGTDDIDFADNSTFSDPLLANDDYLYDVILQPDDMILAAGGGSIDDNVDFLLLRLTSDGALDPGFGTGGIVYTNFNGSNDFAYSVLLQPDLKIVAAGSAFNYYWTDFAVARYGNGFTVLYDHTNDQPIVVYPNPAGESCVIGINGFQNDDIAYDINDIMGLKIMTGIFPEGRQLVFLELSELPPGIYFVELKAQSNETMIGREKFMVR